MKTTWLAFGVSILTAAAAAAGDAQKEECPVPGLIARWEAAKEAREALGDETRAAVADARATLSASCPFCQEGPSSFALLGRFLAASVAFDERCAATTAAIDFETPAEVAETYEARIHSIAAMRDLHAAFADAMEAEGSHCAAAFAARPAAEGTAEEFRAMAREAAEQVAAWKEVPERFAKLPAEEMAAVMGAMERIEQELPTCALASDTMAAFALGFDRVTAFDAELARHCEAATDHADVPAELAALMPIGEARLEATKAVAELVRAMAEAMRQPEPEAPRTAGV